LDRILDVITEARFTLLPVMVDASKEDMDAVLATNDDVFSIDKETELIENVFTLIDDVIIPFIRIVEVCMVDARITRA
jgi:hypothetical protein